MIIGLTGTIGAGKGTVVEYLKKIGFKHYSVRDFLVAEIEKRGMPMSRDSMTIIADQLREEYGPGYIMFQMLDKAKQVGGNSIIESIRAVGEIEALREKAPDFYLIAIDAPVEIRYERVIKRGSFTDHITFQKFLDDEAKESKHGEKWQKDLPTCIALSDVIIHNDTTVRALEEKVEEYLREKI